MTPAEKVIKLFGGIRPAARILDINYSSVSSWKHGKSKKTKGRIPAWHHAKILRAAKQLNLPISKEDLY